MPNLLSDGGLLQLCHPFHWNITRRQRLACCAPLIFASGGDELCRRLQDVKRPSVKLSARLPLAQHRKRIIVVQRCTIDGPSQEEGGQDEVVSGSSQFGLKSVEVCCITMEETVHFTASVKVAASSSLEYTHFISLPLAVHPTLVEKVNSFQNFVLSSLTEEQMNDDTDLEKDNTGLLSKMGCGIEESIFIKPVTLHLTVLMLKLWNKERVAAAAEVLQGATSKLLGFLESRPLAVHLRGVECMRGSPAKAHVLYAKVEETDQENRLAQACKIIINEFLEAGLVLEKDKHQELKLHVTLMNTSYRKRKRGKRFSKRVPFDARQILATYGSEDWGEYKIVAVHLSQRFLYGEDGYYHCCASIQLPPLS